MVIMMRLRQDFALACATSGVCQCAALCTSESKLCMHQRHAVGLGRLTVSQARFTRAQIQEGAPKEDQNALGTRASLSLNRM